MAESLVINNTSSTEEKYKLLNKQIKVLLNRKENIVTNLANFIAALKQTFEKISWVGFYLSDGKKLYLGPYQGKVACTQIEIGKGVCGTSAKEKVTLIVPDVNQFPGHIACDVDSKSEIVIPIVKNGEIFGVLDLDSTDFNSFDEIDKKYLEDLVKFLIEEII